MEILRKQCWDMFDSRYYPKYQSIDKMEPIRTGIPGIACQKCIVCNSYYHVNFLEDHDNIIDCPDYLIIKKSNIERY